MATAAASIDKADKGRSADKPTDIPSSGWLEIAKRTWKEVGKDNVGIVAAGVAFYFFLALVPLLGATVLTYGLFAEPDMVVRQAQGLTAFLPEEAAKLVGEQLLNVVETSGGKKGFGLVAAIAVAFWGARNAAGAIVTSLNIAYQEEEKRGIVATTLLALAMTLGAVVLAGLVGAAVAILAAIGKLLPDVGPIGRFLTSAITFVMLGGVAASAAATLYRYGPSRENARWTWLTPGSIFFAVVWLLLTLAFGFYVRNFGSYGATYGALSSVVVLLTWLYLSSYVLIFGAELNSEVEHQTARDTTTGEDEQPLGARGAWSADHVAAGKDETDDGSQGLGGEPPAPTRSVAPYPPAQDGEGHPYLASRIASRTGPLAGARRISMLSSGIATLALGFLGTRGREKTGAVLLVTAAGLALLKRR
ncbi:YihY/virulence factor BrkB family protein [Sphingomonas glaciei]|uniref:YihY/virulence factor BrkB family protein n=1 Tax=Sphingomonas glaciei TaxID=2938948 RepID=A0ABY5MX85_9SPHN|nr:YihY/virulence factor BrkB family protein [Sphingomonas glaciei]UUR08737.1 YihY/virulence factor BrkB family protein [Sphingomonas glaciei]